MGKVPVAVLISGNGSNLQAIIDACASSDYPAEVVLVISNKAEAFGLERAKKANIPTLTISHKDYPTREAFDAELHMACVKAGAKLVCLAGFMRLLTPEFVQKWDGRMLNIHPSLLPAFKGAHAIRDALAAGAEETGCTVHFVVPEMDSGPIILQRKVQVLPGDTEETLAPRIHAEEHACYVAALKKVAENSSC